MPFELVNRDHGIAWVRADGTTDTEGKAKAFFANESGEDFTNIRVSKVYMHDPGPECECGDVATCGLRYHWKDSHSEERSTSEYLSCEQCQKQALVEPLGTASKVEPISLEEATPFDGWPMESCAKDAPGAVAYWRYDEVASA